MRRWQWIIGFLVLSGLSFGGYLGLAAWNGAVGFPLDDAWIHQTYARNLALHGEWAFQPGQPSAGSTAPLWSALLVPGHWWRFGPLPWTFLSGWILLSGLALTAVWTLRSLLPGHRPAWAVAGGCLLALEWHLVWAAGSGMETLLFAWLVLLALTWLLHGRVNWLAWGALCGLSTWVRPDGITLLGPGILVLLSGMEWRQAGWRRLFSLFTGAALFVGPYLLFNRLLAGAWWPNTFYAKQAEYAALRQLPLLQRWLTQAWQPLVGVGLALLPGVAGLALQALRRRQVPLLAGLLWMAGYWSLYAWRLPVTYQHARYLIPSMPVFFLWGLGGMVTWLRLETSQRLRRFLSRTWLALSLALLVVFWVAGLRAYIQDVALIDSEMVTAARWINIHTEPEAIIAAHDIGALGYFGERRIVDLAGLVSPEVIPFIRDEARLAEFLDAQGARYLLTFPDWYPQLVLQGHLLYQTNGKVAPTLGEKNMCVYQWK